LPVLRKPWSASDEEIEALVRVAGRLFIIASMSFLTRKSATPHRK
jgi:hypothetical protein